MGDFICIRNCQLDWIVNNIFLIQKLDIDYLKFNWVDYVCFWNGFAYKLLYRKKLQGILKEFIQLQNKINNAKNK